MPYKCGRVCACGRVVAGDARCVCQSQRRKEADQRRPNANDRAYDSKWSKARRTFLDKHPHCAMCGKPAVVVDHVRPHKGNRTLFWDKGNWQPLCTHHHNSTKQSIERRQ